MENAEKIKQIKSRLPHGSQAQIADKVGISRAQLNYFFLGRGNPPAEIKCRILKEAKTILETSVSESEYQDLLDSIEI